MTEKDILRKEYARLIGRLEEVDPVTNPGLFKGLLESIESLYNLSGLYYEDVKNAYGVPTIEGFNTPVADDEPSEEEFHPPVMVTPEKTKEPYVEPTPFPESEETAPMGKTYTKEEVRAALAKSRKKGTNVTELLAEFGASNFTGLPAAKYGELMARLGED